MIESVYVDERSPLGGSFQGPLADRHAGGIGDPVHHLDASGRQIVGTTGEDGVYEVQQHGTLGDERIAGTVGNGPWIEVDGDD
jgi:hypothetical protein